MIKPGETFHFNSPISIEGSWMLGLTSLEVFTSFFNITEDNNIFELYKDNSDDFAFVILKDAVEEYANVPNISAEDWQSDTLGPIIINIYGKLQ